MQNMRTADFMDFFKDKNSYISNFDNICEFLSNDLPDEFYRSYDIDDLIKEMFNVFIELCEYDKALKIIELLKQKFPELYEETFEFYEEFVVDYHCFHNNKIEAEKGFSKFVEQPVHDFHLFEKTFEKFLFYQHIDIIDDTIKKVYRILKEEEVLSEFNLDDLTNNKYFINLENFYSQTDNSRVFSREMFVKSLFPYGFNFKNEEIIAIEKGLFENNLQIDEIRQDFFHERKTTLFTIESLFLKEMKNKNFHFAVSGFWFSNMMNFLENLDEKNKNKNTNIDDFFSINEDTFLNYLCSIASILPLNNDSKMVAILWGCVYIYDFLLSFNLISRTTYDNSIEIIKKMKAKVICQFTNNLWSSNFIHQWTKPDSISENEFIEEQKIFQKSIFFTSNEFSKIEAEIADELKNIGELSEYIEKFKDDDKFKPVALLDILMEVFEATRKYENKKENILDISEAEEVEDFPSTPVTREKKIGRNDPCPCGSGKKYKKCCG